MTDYKNVYIDFCDSIVDYFKNTTNANLKKIENEFKETMEDDFKFVSTAINIAKKMSSDFQIKKSAFEKRNESYKKSGSINLSHIVNYRTSENIFHNTLNIRQGKNHGLVILIDNSGSMENKLNFIAKQFLIICLYCHYAGISFDIFTFTTKSDLNLSCVQLATNFNSVKEIINLYYAIALRGNYMPHRSALYADRFEDIISTLPANYMANTPLLQGTAVAYHKAMEMKSRGIENVTIIKLTDGISNDSSGNTTTHWEDPYSNRVFYNENYEYTLPNLNKLIRLHNIKIFNIFINSEKQSKSKFKKNLLMYINNYTIFRSHNNEMFKKNKKIYDYISNNLNDDYVVLDGFLNYNKFFAIVPKYVEEIETSNLKTMLKNKISDTKSLNILGEHINDIVCEDFAI